MRTPYDLARNFMGRMFGQRGAGGIRDMATAFGYPQTITANDFLLMYLRNGVASRVVRSFPQATWRDYPLIRDEKGDSGKKKVKNKTNPNYSPFVEAVENFFDEHNILHYLERADRLAGVNRFGILIYGFSDGGTLDSALPAGKHKLAYLSAYGEPRVRVSQFELDQLNPRYGMPVMYQVSPGSTVASNGEPTQGTFNVHYSRVLHLAEHLDENEVFGTPRLMPVYNHLLDLEKVVGSGAETFWLNARGGMSITADKDADIDAAVLQDMKNQAEEFEHQLRRIIALQGAKAEMMHSTTADPKSNVEASLQLIAGGTGIPLRILIGSERGELSSAQDENNWAARIDERQVSYATPRILKPFVAKMIETGNFPASEGVWWIEWPSSASLSPTQLAEISLKKAQALATYANSPGASLIVPEQEFRVNFLDLLPESEYGLPEEDEDDDEMTGDITLLPGPDLVPAEEKPQDTALNGAQIASLKGIVEAIGLGTLAPETAILLIGAGFPAIPVETIKQLVATMVAFLEEEGNEPEQIEQVVEEAVVTINSHLKPYRIFGKGIHTFRVNFSDREQSLYVRRNVLNGEAIRAHFRAQGIDPMTPAEEMHVTLAYSRTPVDWFKIDPIWDDQRANQIDVPKGGARMMNLFGKSKKNVLVLQFSAATLSWRFQDFMNAGASWDWLDFSPHITISYDVEQSWGQDNSKGIGLQREWEEKLKALEPWQGEIILGPEIFETLTEDWSKGLKENDRV